MGMVRTQNLKLAPDEKKLKERRKMTRLIDNYYHLMPSGTVLQKALIIVILFVDVSSMSNP